MKTSRFVESLQNTKKRIKRGKLIVSPSYIVSVPSSLQDLNLYNYSTGSFAPLKFCDASISTFCSCGHHYMVGTYGRTTFCLNTFFLTDGNNTVFPICNAPCCGFDCGELLIGNQVYIHQGFELQMCYMRFLLLHRFVTLKYSIQTFSVFLV